MSVKVKSVRGKAVILKKLAEGESSRPIPQGLASGASSHAHSRKGSPLGVKVNAIKNLANVPLKHSSRVRALCVLFCTFTVLKNSTHSFIRLPRLRFFITDPSSFVQMKPCVYVVHKVQATVVKVTAVIDHQPCSRVMF